MQSNAAEPKSVREAYDLLVRLGAPPRLLAHAGLVAEAAEPLLTELQRRHVRLDADFVRVAAVLHDAGKILHPEELQDSGSEHEAAGERLLLAEGVAPALARCCMSHAQWERMACSLEELLVALADHLWKGERKAELERRVIERIAERTGQAFWALFVELDTCFEAIAAGGTGRLLRSQTNAGRVGR
jgi:HD superfamily phosphodiesterase